MGFEKRNGPSDVRARCNQIEIGSRGKRQMAKRLLKMETSVCRLGSCWLGVRRARERERKKKLEKEREKGREM